jgi:hypothetical protein
MSFININKVTLEGGSGDIRKDLSDVMLLMASVVYDYIQEEKFNDALQQIELLQSSIRQVKYVIDKDNESFCKDFLGEINKTQVKLIKTDMKGKTQERTFDDFILFAKHKDGNTLATYNINTMDLLGLSKKLEIEATQNMINSK